MNNVCVVCECGWIICGKIERRDADVIKMIDASVVRKWLNGRGIGAISKVKYRDDYTLDEIGAVEIRQSKVLFEIPCEW